MVSRRRPIVPATLAVVGGATIVAGSLLTWLDVSGGISVGGVVVTGTPRGTDLLFGKVVFGTGIAVLLFGLLLLAIRRARRLLGILLIVGGVLALATGAYIASTPTDRYVDFAAAKAAPAGQLGEVTDSLTRLFEAANLQADPMIGLYVVIGGGLLSSLGGLIALSGRYASRAVEDEPAVSEPVPSSPERSDELPGTGESASEPRPAEEIAAAPMDIADPRDPVEVEAVSGIVAPAQVEEAPPPVKPTEARGPSSDAPWVAGPGPGKKRGLRIFRRNR